MSGGRTRVITEPLGGSALSQAIQSRQLPAALQPVWPADSREWRTHAERVRGRHQARWLESLRPALQPEGDAARRLERVAEGRGVVVTTGQQAGLFGGPLYTLSKALTALTIADAIEKQCGVPAAPVFWAATDDADFLEASVTYVADADGLVELRSTNTPAAGTAMALAPLGDMSTLLRGLRTACASAAHAEFFEAAREAYVGGGTVGDAYVRLLRGVLQPLGIAVMDSSHDAYREIARPILLEALKRAPEIAAANTQRAAALRELGFEPQVEDDRGLSLVFVTERNVKRRPGIAEAKGLAASRARDMLSPNVLLRPVVERELFPTIAYVAGPGELAYFTQANAVATALEREPLVAVPRWSCTLVEPFADRALRRLGVEPGELRNLHALERRLATAALPTSVGEAWQRLTGGLRDEIAGLKRAASETELVPPEVIDGLERSLRHKLGRAERRLLAAAKRRDERVRHDLTVASAALFPMGHRQERMLNFVPMLARGGSQLLNDMRAAAATHAAALVPAAHGEVATAAQ
jgi:bacillithiol biosynthesis cysteine-adding enzyme BshC